MEYEDTQNERLRFAQLLRKLITFAIKYLAILVGMGIGGILILSIVYLIPVNQSLKESTFTHTDLMGFAPLVNNRYTDYSSYFTSYEPGALDDATDLIILNNAFDEGEESVIQRAADMNNYGRYWHGYVSVLRPIFYFMDYWDFLLVNSFMQLLLMGAVGYGIFKVTGQKRYLLAFFSSCVFLTPAATAMSLQYTPVFYISMLGSLFCLLKTDWILVKNRRYYLFLILGIVTCYFDFLTYPLLSFAFPFCWLLVAAGKKINLKAQTKILFGSGLSFLFGYGGFFVVKWLIQAVICGKDIIANGLNSAFFYLKSANDAHMLLHQAYSRIDCLYNNFRHYLNPAFVVILSLWMSLFIYKFIRGGLQIKSSHVIFIVVTLTSLAWYFILNTHTAIHHMFTYRIYGASILGFMLFVCGSLSDEGRVAFTMKFCIKRILVVSLCFAVGLCFSRLAKEDWATINGGDYTELILQEDDMLEFEFTPAIKNIKGFSFCLKPISSVEGDLCIEIVDNNIICEKMQIPIKIYEETVFELRLTDWNLDAGKQYIMKVYITNNTSGINLYVNPEGVKPQPEYGNSFLNQEPVGDITPLSGIVYRGHFQTIPVKLFLSVCVGTFLLAWGVAVYAFYKKKMYETFMPTNH